jgi:putative colanic acid biosynthesis UDP-glucose lipid carrier transferase
MVSRGILREHASIVDAVHRFLDLFAVVAGALIANHLRFGGLALDTLQKEALVLGVVFAFVAFRWFNLYHSWRGVGLVVEFRRLTIAWLSVFAALTVVAFALQLGDSYSRLWAGGWWLSTWLLLLGIRLAARLALRWFRYGGGNQRRVVLVGATDLSARVIHQLRDLRWIGLRVVGVFSDTSRGPDDAVFEGVPVWGEIREVVHYARTANVDQVWFCLPLRDEDQMQQLFMELQDTTVDVRLVPDIFGFNLLNHSLTDVAGIPVINLSESPLQGGSRLVKEVEDRVLALAILVLVSPLMLLIAVGVKVSSPGPVLFKQLRHGWDGKPIEVWKFRTMRAHEDPEGSVPQARRGDARITQVGAFLRRTSLDELPQFVNVLQGRMSIVGPRPHAIVHNEKYRKVVDRYMLRHKVKPGITGWAQVNGLRGETQTVDQMRERVEYDLYYINNWSLWFDLKIIVMTFVKGFVHKNAY